MDDDNHNDDDEEGGGEVEEVGGPWTMKDIINDLDGGGGGLSSIVEDAVVTTRTVPHPVDAIDAMDTTLSILTEPHENDRINEDEGGVAYRGGDPPSEGPTTSSSPPSSPTTLPKALPDGESFVNMRNDDDAASSYHHHHTEAGDESSSFHRELTVDDKEGDRNVGVASTCESSTPVKTAPRDSDEMKGIDQRPLGTSPQSIGDCCPDSMLATGTTDALEAVETEEAPSPNTQLGEVFVNEDGSAIGCDPKNLSQDNFEGTTGDTLVPSGSEGWSIYDCETQMLPTAPSQVIPPAASSSVVDPSKGQNPAMNARASDPKASFVDGDVCMPKDQNKQAYAKQSDGNDEFIIEEREVVHDCEDSSPPHTIMKQTPENGSLLHISYPMDHLSYGVDASSSSMVETSCNADGDDDNVEKVGDVGDEATTEMSQDLLLASPFAAKSNDGSGFRNKPLDNPTQTNQFASSNFDHASTFVNEEECGYMALTKSTSPSRRDNSGEVRASWMTSARRKDDKTPKRIRSPRLQIPSFKPIVKDSKDCTVMNECFDDGEVDDGSESEDDSLPGNVDINEGFDSIENTQDESEMNERASAFKRLSRGTLKSAHNDSNVKWTNESKPKASSADGVVIKPKVLRYERQDSSSEAEFSDGEDDSSDDLQQPHISRRFAEQPRDVDEDNAVVDHQQSQTDQRIREQLREINAILPIAKEIQNNVSRNRQLRDELAQLKISHQASVKKLNREKNNLATQLKAAETLVKQKDEIIKSKNMLLDKQFAVIAQMKGALGVGHLLKGSPSASIKRTPPTVTATKSKKRTGSESDSGDDDDKVLISALKKKPSSSCKKMHGAPFSSSTAKKMETGLVPYVDVSSDRDSGETSLIDNRSNNAKSRNGSVRSNISSSNLSNFNIWKKLQNLGWKYVCGPEPHNKGE
jgi:hypothetical protein